MVKIPADRGVLSDLLDFVGLGDGWSMGGPQEGSEFSHRLTSPSEVLEYLECPADECREESGRPLVCGAVAGRLQVGCIGYV